MNSATISAYSRSEKLQQLAPSSSSGTKMHARYLCAVGGQDQETCAEYYLPMPAQVIRLLRLLADVSKDTLLHKAIGRKVRAVSRFTSAPTVSSITRF